MTFQLSQITFDNSNEILGQTPAGQDILLGGFSGLYFDIEEDGKYYFYTVPDRGPNGEPTDTNGDGIDERPFALPDYQARIIRLEYDPELGTVELDNTILLTNKDGTPITGLPNLQAQEQGLAYTDEIPIDLNGNVLTNDPFGADLESIILAPDGTFWASDEYRPAIYHFDENGVLIDRFIPAGTAEANGNIEGTYGTETLPEVYAQRRANRGFEGMALDTDNNKLYAWIQSPIDNPDVTNNANSRNSVVLRILEVDPTNGEATGEYIQILNNADEAVDKIGDAVYQGDGKFFVIERDSAVGEDSNKLVFEIDLNNATNILNTPLSSNTSGFALEGFTEDEIKAIDSLDITRLGSYETGLDGGAEIAAYDPENQLLFVTNGAENQVDIIDISDPTNPSLTDSISLDEFGGGLNSVAVKNGVYAIAVQANTVTDNGFVLVNNVGSEVSKIQVIEVGALPDMVTFTPDGNKILVANEGEPNEDYTVDPEGSVSIIDISNGLDKAAIMTADFTEFNVQEDQLKADGVRIFGLNASVAEDVEPEYIAVSPDGLTAVITLQENNAIAILDIENATITDIIPLGFKDHSLAGNGLDASDRDDAINIQNYPIFGMYQPDSIAAYQVGEKTYYVTANEGDARLRPTDDDILPPPNDSEGDIFNEEDRVKDLVLDPDAFPNAEELQQDENLGRLTVTNTLGDTDGDGDFDQLYAFGTRSFSIWNSAGQLVFDSGDQLEQITAALFPDIFNSQGNEESFDSRSDNKGPEPEGLTIGTIGDKTYAFIGLERIGGFMTYDITDPTAPKFVNYTNDTNIGDISPEGVLFIPSEDSPTEQDLLVVTNEVSGNTVIYSLQTDTGIQPVEKTFLFNAAELGYIAGDKTEGLALLPNGNLAIINDNDFGLLAEEIPVDGSVPINPEPVPIVLGIVEEQIRFATFNAALNRNSDGQLFSDLSTPNQQQIKNVAEIIQRVDPDVLLINEFDFNTTNPLANPQLFLENYLEVQQNAEVDPTSFEYIYVAPSNTGVASGFDLDRNGVIVTTPGEAGYGNDAWGFGNFEGQFAMVLFSKYPILTDEVRTFQNFLWKDMPNALLPDDPDTSEPNDWYSEEILAEFPLSSKSHWDVPIDFNGETIHVLVSHPTPPVFDGEEDRNGRRNSDEIRFWSDYVTPGAGDYIYDDNGNTGGLTEGAAFVIMGDQNADPFDGDSTPPAISQLLDNPNIQGSATDASITPSSQGGTDAAERQGGANNDHIGDPAFDTGDFNDNNPGNLRVDYVLPSNNLTIGSEAEDKGVFWLTEDDPDFDRLIGDFDPNLDPEDFPTGVLSSDHRLVYVDVTPTTTFPPMFIEDFNLFTGTGFAPNPNTGLLDSNAWIITGLSDGNLNFGDTATSGDFARGTSTGGVTSGGVYSFEVASGNNILGVQPTGSDFTPGEIILKLQNTGDTPLTEVEISYDISFFNDQGRANSLNFSYSEDNATYIPLSSLDFTTPEAADTSPIWETVNRSITINELTLNPDDLFYLKWTGDDVSGAGSRDEYGIDNISVSNLTLPEIDPPTVTTEFIHTIQGEGFVSPLTGETVIIEAIVVADFQGSTGLSGFFLQEDDADADDNPLTSEGIFIFDTSSPTVDVEIGDLVQVTGTVTEFNNLTQLNNITEVEIISSDNPLPTVATVNFPISDDIDLESVEGMLVTLPDTLFVTEYFNLDRFGEIRLSSNGDSNAPNTDGRLDQYTQFNAPDADGFSQYQEDIAKRQITLDDGSSVQNPFTLIFGRNGNPISQTNTLRGGDTVTGITAVLDERFGNYRLQTNQGVDFQAINERPATPEDVGGSLKVASFNVLNFFTTLDDGSGLGSGPNNLDPRGADSQEEFDRQLEKLVTTLTTLDADIVGLLEIENEFGGDQNGDGQYAIDTLVNALNAELGEGTYAYVDSNTDFVGSDAIAVGVIYKPAKVQIAPNTTVELLTDADLPSLDVELSGESVFEGDATSRVPLAVTFLENATGEQFTLAVNHFKSKGQSGLGDTSDPNFAQGDGQGFWNFRREEAAKAVDAWLKTDPTGSGDSDYLVIGDLNAYAQEDPITFFESQGYTDLAEEFIGDGAYSFLFDGQFGTLDYGLANESLSDQVTGATEWHINADEPDALDYNLDFGRDPDLFDGTIPFRTSDHDPLIIGLDLSSEAEPFTLQILHASDQEAGVPAFQDIPGLSAVMNALEDDYENTLKLTSGDLFIAGPFFDGSRSIYDSASQGGSLNQPGIADILIQNELGWDVASVGNHEFDAGDETFFSLLAPNADWVNGEDGGVGIGEEGYLGALFPYLANNLDYSNANLPEGLTIVENGGSPLPNTLTGSVITEVNGEEIGIIGIVTPYLESIANTGNVEVTTDDADGNPITPDTPIADQVDSIIANITSEIEALTNSGVNKLILMTHLQESAIEQALAQELANLGLGIDVLIGGGSHQVMANDDTIPPLRQDETQQLSGQLLQPYPQAFSNGNDTVLYVNTGANYRYLSQLVITFDENGVITSIGDDSGTFATDIAGVDRLYDEEITTIEQVKAVADPEVVAIVEGVETFVNNLDGNIFGQSDVFLNGTRGEVRTQETNLGNLSADSQDYYAEAFLEEYDLLSGFDKIDISFKNGGGIRDNIGVSFIAGGSNELIQLPPQANPAVGKEEGDISELDISNSLRFNNDLVVGTVTAEGLLELAEHMVSAVELISGRFGQIGGFKFSYDPDAPANSRIDNLALTDEEGNSVKAIIEDGELVVDADETFSIVTLGFLAEGGDGYADVIQNQVKLSDFAEPDALGRADLTVGGEQDALAEYFAAFFNDENGQDPFNQADTPESEDERIQNLNEREDTVLDGIQPPTPPLPRVVSGTPDADTFEALFPDDQRFEGDNQILLTGSGDDYVDVTGAEGGNTIRLASGDDILFGGKNDRIDGGAGDDIFFLGLGAGNNRITGGSDADQFWISEDDTHTFSEGANMIADFDASEGDVIGLASTALSFGSADFNLIQDGANTIIETFGQEIAILNGVNAISLIEDNFVFA